MEEAEEGLDCACDALSLARERERLKASQWTAERLDAANYGPKQEITHSFQPILNITLAALPQAPQVIDLPADAVQQVEEKKP